MNYSIARLLGRSTAGSLHPRLLRKGTGQERGKEEDADSRDPADSDEFRDPRTPFLSPFVSFPHLAHVSLYLVSLCSSRVLLTIFTE